MGYGIIIGGGGSELNYSWVTATSYANLPTGKPANTLGFITSTSVPNVRWKNSTISGLSTGDVVMREGVTSSTPFNMLSSGDLWVYPTGAYQYNGSILVGIDVYWYSGSAWALCSAIFYDNGTIPTNVNDFLAYKVSGTSVEVTKNASEMYCSISSATGWVYSQYTIDVTYINTLWFTCKSTTGTALAFGIIPNYNSSTNASSVFVTSTTYTNASVDVSAKTGAHYIFYGYTGNNTTRTAYVQKIWGV